MEITLFCHILYFNMVIDIRFFLYIYLSLKTTQWFGLAQCNIFPTTCIYLWPSGTYIASYMYTGTSLTKWWRHQMETFSALLALCHKGHWRGALMFSLIWIKRWANNRKAGDLRRHRAHYDINVMKRDWLNQFYAKGSQSHPHKIKNMINYSFSWFQCRYG